MTQVWPENLSKNRQLKHTQAIILPDRDFETGINNAYNYPHLQKSFSLGNFSANF